MKNIILANNEVVFSEIQDNPTYISAKFVVCDFLPNLNNVMLNRKTISNWITSLIDQPVVGKLGNTDSGESDFTGHNANIVVRLGEDGEPYQDMIFDTSALGVFTNVEIESIGNKEYITATAKIWKRFPDFCAVIKKRINSGISLNTSWEVLVNKSHTEFINGSAVKVIDDGVFAGHCMLGSYIPPAYKDSKLLEVASKKDETIDDELVEALKRDIVASKDSNINIAKKEDEILDKENETVVSENTEEKVESEIVTETAEIESTETSALTEYDLRQALRQAIADKLNIDKWEFYVIYNFPTDGIIWIQLWNSESELDVIEFTYTVENDVVTMSEPTNAKLSVSVAQINVKVAELNETIEKQTASLVEASAKVQDLTKEVSSLIPFKESCEKAEQERIDNETAEKRENLKAYAIKSGFISEEEVSSIEEIKNCVANVDEKGLKAIIAERFMQSLDCTPDVETSNIKDTKAIDVEISEVKTNIVDCEEDSLDYKSTMSAYLNK